MSDQSIVIVSGVRTPMGGFQGSLSSISAVDLGAISIREAVSRAGIDTVNDTLNEVSRGNRTLPRTALLDILQAIGTTQAAPQPGDSVELLGNVPDVWASIAQDFARHPLLDCPLPFSWLKQITARICDGFIELRPETPLVRDQLRNRFHQLLSDCCRKHGLQLAVA